MRQLSKLDQLRGVARGAVGIMDQNFAAAAVGGFDRVLQNFADCHQKSGSFGGAAQRTNLVAGLYGDAHIQNAAICAERLRNLYSFHDAWRKHKETVISAAATGGSELARRHPTRHAAGFHEFIHAADVVRNLRSVSATAARTEFEEHRTFVGVAEFNMGGALCESECAHRAMAHIADDRFLRRSQLGGVLDADVDAIRAQRFDFLADAEHRSLAVPDEHFGAVLAALHAMFDDDV